MEDRDIARPTQPSAWMNPRTLTYHLVTLAGFLVIDWLFDTPLDLLDAAVFLVGLQLIAFVERKLRG